MSTATLGNELEDYCLKFIDFLWGSKGTVARDFLASVFFMDLLCMGAKF
jgi:hypothetical protein